MKHLDQIYGIAKDNYGIVTIGKQEATRLRKGSGCGIRRFDLTKAKIVIQCITQRKERRHDHLFKAE